MKRILLASVAALGFSGTASAADLAVKAPVVYAPAFTWTGCYLGVNGGWIGSSEEYRLEPTGRYLVTETAAARAQRTYNWSNDESAGTAGGQFGCQWQWGAVVLGGEWDFNWSGLTEDNYIAAPGTANWGPTDFWTHKQLDWFSTARVRLGWAIDRLLIYGTAGLAWGAYDAFTQIDFTLLPGGPEFFGGYREKRIGWTAGAGIEWAFANNWTAKAEFLYLDFDSFDYLSPWIPDTRFSFTTRVDAQEYVARVGINYLFHLGGAPVVAKY